MVPKKVHAWEIKGYAKIKKELRDIIRQGLKEKYSSLNKAEIALKLSDYYHRKLHETSTRKDILFRLIKEANINKYKAEKYITEWKDTIPQKGYKISFPIKLNIFYVRIISHIIGDGTIGNNYTWCQKDVTPLETLQKKLFGKSLKNREKVITIPQIIVKIITRALNINQNKLTKAGLLKELIKLPKDYRIQILNAIIEDEGTCDKNRLTIRMNNKEIMSLIIRLIDSLSYLRTPLTKQYYKRYGIKKPIWKVSLNIEGIRRYQKDLNKIEEIYGKCLGLWKKRNSVEELSKHKSNLKGYKRNKKLRKK